MQKWNYTCTEQTIPDEEGGTRTGYRFTVTEQGRALLCVDDVCGSEHRARELERLFRRNQVSPVHVLDVLEDWLIG